MIEPHPNDLVEFAQYPDAGVGLRQIYPPLPRTMGNPNAVAPESIVGNVLARRQADRQRKGMSDDTATLSAVTIPPEVSASPEVAQMQAAGWL